jgi:hypothetical protein
VPERPERLSFAPARDDPSEASLAPIPPSLGAATDGDKRGSLIPLEGELAPEPLQRGAEQARDLGLREVQPAADLGLRELGAASQLDSGPLT